MLPWEILNFQNLRNAIFWHSGTDVCIIANAVTIKFKGNFFGDPSFTHHIFSAASPSPPFESNFLHVPPQIPPVPLPTS